MSPARVVCITIPVLCIGGSEVQTLDLVRVFVGAGYAVTVCCFGESDPRMVTAIEQMGARFESSRGKFSNGLFHLLKTLVKFLRQQRPAIVHVQYLAPGLIPIIAARLAGVKRVFATVHQPGRPYGLKAKILIRVAAYLCDAFFCNSRAVEESWFGSSQIFGPAKDNGRKKHFTIYNGVDTERIERIVQNTDNERIKDSLNVNGKKVIGVVGRLRKEKGQIYILEAMKMIVREMPDVVLLVVGEGPDRQYLEQVAKKLGIEDHVKWLGQRDHDEVLGLYTIMDVVVVPSLFEGFGLTAAEAMAACRPVVASDVDGLSELIVDNVTGYLVPARECELMASRLVELLSNKEKAEIIAQAGYRRVAENFGMGRFARSMNAVYHFYGA